MAADNSSDDRFRSLHSIVLVGVLAILALLTALLSVARLSGMFKYLAKSYNEGWYALHVDTILTGLPLYPPRGGLVMNNYPPLWFYVTAEVTRWTDDIVFASRIITAVSFACIGLFIGIFVHRITRDRTASLTACLIFLLSMLIGFPYSVGFGDPQMLAHAVMLGGLAWHAGAPGSVRRVWILAFIMTTALFMKHNPVSLPMAVGITLLLHDRRIGLHYVTAGVGSALAGLLVCYALFGYPFIDGLLSARRYGARAIVDLFFANLMPLLPLLALGSLGIAIRARDEWTTLIASYLALATALGLLWSGGSGVSANIFIDVVIGCAMAGGLLVAHAGEGWTKPVRIVRTWSVCALAIAALCTPGLLYARSLLNVPGWIAHEAALDVRTRAIVETIHNHPGRVLCEMPAICYWSGKKIEVDPFNRLEAVIAGRTDKQLLRRMVEERAFALILVTRDWPQTIYFPDIVEAVQAHYRPTNASDDPAFIILAPRSGGICPPDSPECVVR